MRSIFCAYTANVWHVGHTCFSPLIGWINIKSLIVFIWRSSCPYSMKVVFVWCYGVFTQTKVGLLFAIEFVWLAKHKAGSWIFNWENNTQKYFLLMWCYLDKITPQPNFEIYWKYGNAWIMASNRISFTLYMNMTDSYWKWHFVFCFNIWM